MSKTTGGAYAKEGTGWPPLGILPSNDRLHFRKANETLDNALGMDPRCWVDATQPLSQPCQLPARCCGMLS